MVTEKSHRNGPTGNNCNSNSSNPTGEVQPSITKISQEKYNRGNTTVNDKNPTEVIQNPEHRLQEQRRAVRVQGNSPKSKHRYRAMKGKQEIGVKTIGSNQEK